MASFYGKQTTTRAYPRSTGLGNLYKSRNLMRGQQANASSRLQVAQMNNEGANQRAMLNSQTRYGIAGINNEGAMSRTKYVRDSAEGIAVMQTKRQLQNDVWNHQDRQDHLDQDASQFGETMAHKRAELVNLMQYREANINNWQQEHEDRVDKLTHDYVVAKETSRHNQVGENIQYGQLDVARNQAETNRYDAHTRRSTMQIQEKLFPGRDRVNNSRANLYDIQTQGYPRELAVREGGLANRQNQTELYGKNVENTDLYHRAHIRQGDRAERGRNTRASQMRTGIMLNNYARELGVNKRTYARMHESTYNMLIQAGEDQRIRDQFIAGNLTGDALEAAVFKAMHEKVNFLVKTAIQSGGDSAREQQQGYNQPPPGYQPQQGGDYTGTQDDYGENNPLYDPYGMGE